MSRGTWLKVAPRWDSVSQAGANGNGRKTTRFDRLKCTRWEVVCTMPNRQIRDDWRGRYRLYGIPREGRINSMELYGWRGYLQNTVGGRIRVVM